MYKILENSKLLLNVEAGSYINPSVDSEYLAWIDEGNEPLPVDPPNPNDAIQSQISALESEITSRRLREALTGNADAITWITNQDNKITLLRKQLIRK